MITTARTGLGLFLIALTGAALGQAAPARHESGGTVGPEITRFDPVVVIGYRHPARVSHARLLEGVAAFGAKRSLAPDSVLLFEALDRSGSTRPLRLSLEIGDKAIPIKTDAQGRFTLPTIDIAASGGGDIVANRRSGDLTIRPVVLSPGTTDGTRRLGDLRLQCEVGWAMERHDASLLVRGAYGLAGGACRSSMIAIGFTAPKKLRDVELSLGERSAKARLASTGVTYWPPLHDKSWPDETVVVLKPDNQNRAIALPGPDSQASASRAGG